MLASIKRACQPVWSETLTHMSKKKRQPRIASKQASMADVAQAAGVSVITVSRMLRQPDVVAGPTRRKIEEAMDEVGYVPNLIAGGLAATHTQLVAAIVPYIQHGVFAEAVQGLSDQLSAQGYCVLLGNSGGSADEEESIVRTLLGHRPAGLVIQGGNHTEQTRRLLMRAQIPVVEMGTLPENPIDMSVGYSNSEAARVVVEYFVASGRRRIGFIGHSSENNDRHQQRLKGYRMALKQGGLKFDPTLLAEAGFTIAAGRAAFNELLARAPDLDAVFCSSDLWAAGTVFECQARGIRVPEDIAVSGFNGQEIAAQMFPGLTTIQVRRAEIGSIAAGMILARIAGEDPPEPHVDVGFEFVVRGSS